MTYLPFSDLAVHVGKLCDKLADLLPEPAPSHDYDKAVNDAADVLEDDEPFRPRHERPLDWEGWAVPAILEVLAEHSHLSEAGFRVCLCGEPKIGAFNNGEWREHVAPLIAQRIACDPQRARDALIRYELDRTQP